MKIKIFNALLVFCVVSVIVFPWGSYETAAVTLKIADSTGTERIVGDDIFSAGFVLEATVAGGIPNVTREYILPFRGPKDMSGTVNRVDYLINGATGAAANVGLYYRTASAVGQATRTTILPTRRLSLATLTAITASASFTNAAVPAGAFYFLEIGSTTNTVKNLSLSVWYRKNISGE